MLHIVTQNFVSCYNMSKKVSAHILLDFRLSLRSFLLSIDIGAK